jgi:hypothetical protein
MTADPQAHAVYDAERAAWARGPLIGITAVSIATLECYANSAAGSSWWTSRYIIPDHIAIDGGFQNDGAETDVSTCSIAFGQGCHTLWVLCHELAHIAWTSGAVHGPSWAREYVFIVEHVMGTEAAALLLLEFHRAGVVAAPRIKIMREVAA